MSQSLANVLLHFIFSTKKRMLFIDEQIEHELHSYITSICTTEGSYVHKIGGMPDHIHLFCSLPRTVAISNFIEQIKKNSTQWIKTKNPQYKDFAWQNGYGVFSVSESSYEPVSNYINNQKKHHQKISFQDEYRNFLKLNKIPFDERYLWD